MPWSWGLQPGSAVLISEDWYYRDLAADPSFDPATFDFDDIAIRDHELLAAHLAALKSGETIVAPRYCFVRHAREDDGLAGGARQSRRRRGGSPALQSSVGGDVRPAPLPRHARRHPLHPPINPRSTRTGAKRPVGDRPVPAHGPAGARAVDEPFTPPGPHRFGRLQRGSGRT